MTNERFYFYKLDHKINLILVMLKRNFFCTVAWLWILFLVICHSSSYNLSPVFFCYPFIHIKGETVKNCSEIDCTLSKSSRNQQPKFGVPKERSVVRLTRERVIFFKLVHKINLIPPMLKRNVFCTVVWSKILPYVIICHLYSFVTILSIFRVKR